MNIYSKNASDIIINKIKFAPKNLIVSLHNMQPSEKQNIMPVKWKTLYQKLYENQNQLTPI